MAAIQKQVVPPASGQFAATLFAIVAGLFFFVAILKFGTPVVLDNAMTPPRDAQAAIYESWQVKWGYWLMLPLVGSGLAAIRWKALDFKWPLLLPLVWLGWQFISATQTVNPALTEVTLKHFSACCVLFYLGYFALKGNPWPLWTGAALALCWALRTGLEQHFGGLEATRRMLYTMSASGELPSRLVNDPAYLKRVASSRIFSTFSNADAFAGGIELLLPVTLVFLWSLTPKVRTNIRWLFVCILGGCGLACLLWTGSKAGWLVALMMAMAALVRSAIPTKWKWALLCSVLVLGVAGFGLRLALSTNKEKEKASVVSRYAYWRGAIEIAKRHPVFGGGPGTFSVLYPNFQRPGDDFAMLCHNDYLEQACDSGIPGSIAYSGMILGIIWYLYRYRLSDFKKFDMSFAIWLGVFGLCLHSMVDYHLYIPALSWPMFLFLGFCAKSKD